MLKKFLFGLALILSPSCYSQDMGNDSISMDIDANIILAEIDAKDHHLYDIDVVGCARYHDLFFWWIRDANIEKGHNFSNQIFVFQNGSLIQKVRLTKEFESDPNYYSNMFVRNDSLLIKGYNQGSKDYYIHLDSTLSSANQEWVLEETRPISKIIYEDDDFAVHYNNRGEWGCYLCFVEKPSAVVHTYITGATKIIKKDDGYYLYSAQKIQYIANPREGAIDKLDRREGYFPNSKPIDLFTFSLSKDKEMFYPESDSIFVMVFDMVDDKTCAVISDKKEKETFLAAIDGKKVTKLLTIYPFAINDQYTTISFGRNTKDSFDYCVLREYKNNIYNYIEIDKNNYTNFYLKIKNAKNKELIKL